MLHLLAFAPDNENLLRHAIQRICAGDAVVLLEAGKVFACNPKKFALLADAAAPLHFYLLGDGDIATGLDIVKIDSVALVALTETHDASLSWYP